MNSRLSRFDWRVRETATVLYSCPTGRVKMKRQRRLVLVLDCPYSAWRAERLASQRSRDFLLTTTQPEVHPFTFSDVPYPLVGGEHDVVIKPVGIVTKS